LVSQISEFAENNRKPIKFYNAGAGYLSARQKTARNPRKRFLNVKKGKFPTQINTDFRGSPPVL
jgi:hypothetical protein